MESNLTTPSRPTNNWAPKSGSPTAHLRGCVEPHFLICLGNAHRPSIRQEYTPHHLASRIHDLGTFCLSASLTMTLQRRSYLQAHPASGETGVDFYPAS